MVNAPSDLAPEPDADRRERPRLNAEHAPALGTPKLNPFGDLVTLQHLSVRLAKALKGVFETLCARPVRAFAEPIEVQRFGDYRTERGDALTAWRSLAITPGKGRALLVLDGAFVLELLDCYFGGEGEAPHPLPEAFTPAAEALIDRIAVAIERPLDNAWEPVARIEFSRLAPEGGSAAVPPVEAQTPMIITRFGIADDEHPPIFFDILYPVTALKPYSGSLTAKVHGNEDAPEPAWRSNLTRAAMGVPLRVRSVLAEPVIPASMLMALKAGDVIPMNFGPEVPVWVGNQRFALATVGTANGKAAIKLNALVREEDGR